MNTKPVSRMLATLALAVTLTSAAQATIVAFTNSNGITINNLVYTGPGNPYPSSITVSNTGVINAVQVKITGFVSPFPADVDVFLVAPNGSVSAVFSDVGTEVNPVNVNLIFEDAAANVLTTAPFSSGTYHPINLDPSEPLPPGGTDSIGTALNPLAAGGANGVWNLYVTGDNGADNGPAGSIASWSLVFDTTLPPLTVNSLPATSVTATNATLNGKVNPNSAATTAYFQYGLTASYGSIGGFTVLPATNATLTLPGLVVSSIASPAGATWTQQTNAPGGSWYSIAASADGTKLAAAVDFGGGIWTSTNSGATWTQTSAPGTNWAAIASSSDGTKLAAVVDNGGIWTSTNSGATWTRSSAPTIHWSYITSSADGAKLAAVAIAGGGIWISTNSGGTWAQTSAPSIYWQSIASSAAGDKLVAADAIGGGIWTSTNSGGTWTQQTNAPGLGWSAIASSADGGKLAVAVGNSGRIWTSTNSGGTWTQQTNAPSSYWMCIASSADGTKLAAGEDGGYIHTSTDSGATWTQTSTPYGKWLSTASSADGTKLAAAHAASGIYTSAGSVTPLQPVTTYHFQLVGINAAGTSSGLDLTFTTGIAAPVVTTQPATSITATTATLNGTVHPGSGVTTAYFQYGLSTNYGSFSATNTLAATNSTLPVANLISGLASATAYHFRLVGINSAGTTPSGDLIVTTPTAPSAVTTQPATSVTATNATLNGAVNPNGDTTTTYFQYGLTTNYGHLGGFTVLPATNTTLTLAGLVISSIEGNAGATWTHQTNAPFANWQSIASSADGTKLAAGHDGGHIWTSTNSGGTWTDTGSPAGNWSSIASSADGSKLAATLAQLHIYTSTNSGGTWTQQTNAPSANWQSIASSADGTKLAAVISGGGIWTSTNSGGTWTQQIGAPSANWYSIASSASGTKLAAVVYGGRIYTSTDSGGTWALRSVPNANWLSIAASADGAYLAAVLAQGYVYTSTNGGGNWTLTGDPTKYRWAVASSADGSHLATVDYGGGIYTSTDSGGTWTLNNAPNPGEWTSIASSADGLHLAAVQVNPGGVYTSAGSVTPLQPGTTYHYRLVGINSVGTTLGDDLTFTTPPLLPVVTTLAVSGLTGTNATLNGTVNPGYGATTAYYQYGLTTNYGNFSATNLLTATNATLTLPGLVVSSIAIPAGAVWNETSAPGDSWSAIASSADGTHLAAVAQSGGIWTSTNSGVTWAQTNAPYGVWSAIASSADGTHLAAAGVNSGIWTSTTSGVTWSLTSAPQIDWFSIASSADGTHLAAGVNNGGIWTSTDSGGTWTNHLVTSKHWYSIASSADGINLAAVEDGGIWTSTNSGSTWTLTSGPAGAPAIASSSDGTHLAAVVSYGDIWISTNSGGTWTLTSAPFAPWYSIASSADGTKLAAGVYGGSLTKGIYTSTNSGGTWTKSGAPPANWNSIASSADGSHLAALAYGGGIYTTADSVVPLQPGTTYHYQLLGINSAGTTLGSDLTFTTPSLLPVVTTLAASGLTGTNATLNGTVNPGFGATAAYYQYGLTTNYGSFSATNLLTATNLTLSVSNFISELSPGTTYHYQLVAYNSGGSAAGADLSFTTSSSQPVAFTLADTSQLVGGSFQLSFTNLARLPFSVMASTNVALPMDQWTVLGAPVENPPGTYQFTDTQVTNNATRFYRVRSL